MDDLLFLAHRIPYPPNKGDKIRSFRLLEHLSRHYRVHLATFIDHPADRAYRETVCGYCASAWFGELSPSRAKLASLRGLLTGEALTLPYYRDWGLRRWIRQLCAEHSIRRVLVFSSAMAQYALGPEFDAARRVIDFVDVDSDKWRQYAESKRFPMDWIYRREAVRLAQFEREVTSRFDASLLVSEQEAALFRATLDPAVAGRVFAMSNGVDADYFAPDPQRSTPFTENAIHCVFTGAMDYWANAEGVTWFAREVLPHLRRQCPDLQFWIVGMNPTPAVQRLAELPGVAVTGAVPDVRPYLQHADVVVAPLRIARGIQNKVLEAMAMGKPVVVTPQALEGIPARSGLELLVADRPEQFAECVLQIIATETTLGLAARAFVQARFSWSANLPRVVDLIEGTDR